MGYALMSARKIMLTNRVNQINFQLINLNQAKQSMANQSGNYQRLINLLNNTVESDRLRNFMLGITGGDIDSYTSPEYQDQYMNLFDKFSQINLIESDIDAQIQQLQTQLNAANTELKNLEEGEKNAIERGTPKYA